MRRIVQLFACLVATGLLAPAVGSADPFETGFQPDCTEAAPTVLSTDFSEPIDINVLVLLDGVPQATAERTMTVVARPYAALGINLLSHYAAAPAVASVDPIEILDATRAAQSGRRPAGIDLVYTLTNKNLADPVSGDGVAGMADCIGGIAFGDQGFAVGEVDESPADELGLFGEQTAKIEAHELGHLLGGQHHYANCAQAPPTDADRSGCTLLINDVGLAELTFSTLNASVIRGHAELWRYRGPAPDDPDSRTSTGSSGSAPPSGQAPSSKPSSKPSGKSAACKRAQSRVRRAKSALRSARAAHRKAHTSKGRRNTQRRAAKRAAELKRARRAAKRACATR